MLKWSHVLVLFMLHLLSFTDFLTHSDSQKLLGISWMMLVHNKICNKDLVVFRHLNKCTGFMHEYTELSAHKNTHPVTQIFPDSLVIRTLSADTMDPMETHLQRVPVSHNSSGRHQGTALL